MRIAASLALGAILLARAEDVRAADLPAAHLELSLSPNAGECRNEAHVAEELRRRMTASQDASLGLLVLRVAVDRDGQAYVATIRVDGRKQGVRTLRADGPSCEPLHDALMVALLLLLDEDPTKPPPPAAPTESAPPPSVALAPISAPPARVSPSSQVAAWLSAGGTLTHGLPEGTSLAVAGDVIARLDRWDLAAGAFWAPERTVAVREENTDLGEIQVRLAGARVRGCYAFFRSENVIRVSGCALFVFASLTGQSSNTTDVSPRPVIHQFWGLAGAGADAHLALSTRIAAGIFGGLLVSTKDQGFYIDPKATNRSLTQYASDPVTAWAGLELRMRIW